MLLVEYTRNESAQCTEQSLDQSHIIWAVRVVCNGTFQHWCDVA